MRCDKKKAPTKQTASSKQLEEESSAKKMTGEREIETLINEKRRALAKSKWQEAAELCNFLGNKLCERGQFEEALSQHEEELKLCQRLNDEAGIGLAHRCIGEVLSHMTEYKRALRSLKLFLDISIKRKDVVEIQRAWATIGRVYLMKEDLNQAETAFGQALKLAEKSVSLSDNSPPFSCSK